MVIEKSFQNSPSQQIHYFGVSFSLQVEDQLLREQIEQYNRRLREFEDRQRQYHEDQERQAEAEAEVVQALLRISNEKPWTWAPNC